MKSITNPLEIFQKEAPDVANAFNAMIESLKATKGLDDKTKQLVISELRQRWEIQQRCITMYQWQKRQGHPGMKSKIVS